MGYIWDNWDIFGSNHLDRIHLICLSIFLKVSVSETILCFFCAFHKGRIPLPNLQTRLFEHEIDKKKSNFRVQGMFCIVINDIN